MWAVIQIGFLAGLLHILHLLGRRAAAAGRPPGVTYRVWPHLWLCVSGRGALVLALCGLITVALVVTGWDYDFQRWLQRVDPLPEWLTFGAFVVGLFGTPLLALVLLWIARRRRSGRLRAGASAALQAVIVNFAVVQLLKVLTGRRGPDLLVDGPGKSGPFQWTTNAADFDFAFWAHVQADGRFFWPSGHTASAFALVAALAACHPDEKWIAWIGYPLAAFMGWSMLDGDHHWLSDVVTGAAIGVLVGRTIGGEMRASSQRCGPRDLRR